jgi:hypothetical protein
MSEILTVDSDHDIETSRRFWCGVPFFGSRLEESVSRFWYATLVVPCALLIGWGFWVDQPGEHSLSSVTTILRNPYVASLLGSLFLSAIAFNIWRSTVRQTFATAFETGIVSKEPDAVRAFLSSSSEFEQQIRSRRRFLPIVATILTTSIVTAPPILDIPELVKSGDWPTVVLNLLMCLFLVTFSYGVGAVAWCFITTARWIAALSRSKVLRIQPGHSDGCCGLAGVGNCCLQSALPLIIGMVLCLLWSNSAHVPSFRDYLNNMKFLSFVIFFSDALLLIIFGLACSLVFLPVQGLHARLKAYKQEREREFTGALELELVSIGDALAARDDDRVKIVSDRLRLIQVLDPTKLKLASWPFNSASLIKYGVTPLASLVVSVGKELAKNFIS